MRLAGSIATMAALALLTGAAAAEAASCPARPSPPACLRKTTPFTPAEQPDCVGKAQRYFALNDKYAACLRAAEQRAQEKAAEARSRLACRSTTKRPC